MSEYNAGDGSGAGASMTAQAQEKVQETAQQATQKGAQMLRQQTEARAVQASGELQSVAAALRRSGHALHAEGKQSAATVDAITDRIEQLSGYLGRTEGDKMLRDLEAFGRRRPWGMIGLGLGIGLVASRFLKASSEQRYASTQQQPQQQPWAVQQQPPALPVTTGEPVTQVGYPSYQAE